MNLRHACPLVLPLGLLLTACAPSDRSSSTNPAAEAPSGVSGTVSAVRDEPHRPSTASVLPLLAEDRDRVSEQLASKAGATGHETPQRILPSGTQEGTRLRQGSGQELKVHGHAKTAAPGSRTEQDRTRVELRQPPVGLSGGAATPSGVTVAGGAGGTNAREQSPPLPLAVVAAAYPQAFTPEQMRVLVQLGESFLNETSKPTPDAVTDEVASPGPAPADAKVARRTPAQRWFTSAEASDERFKAMFGYSAFNAMQLARAREAYAEATK
jgi:hypothetical protein